MINRALKIFFVSLFSSYLILFCLFLYLNSKYEHHSHLFFLLFFVSLLIVSMIIIIIFISSIKLEFENLATNYAFVKNREDLILNSITEGVCWVDVKGNIVFANKSAKYILGFMEDEDITGLNFHKLVHGNRKDIPDKCAIEITLKNGVCNLYRNETFVRKNGTTIPVAVFTSPIVQNKKIIGAVVTFIDLTHEVKQQEEIKKYKTIIEQAKMVVVITDKDGNIQYVNPEFERVTGYKRDEAVGQNPRILKSGVHPKSFYENLWNTILSGKMWEGEFINKKKDGTLYNEEANIFPIFNKKGEITNFVAIKKDITKSKKLEEQLIHAQKMEAIGRLVGGIAHDFNNILTIVSGYAEMLEAVTEKNSKQYDYVVKIIEAVDRTKDLISKLLAFSRKQEIKPKPVNIVEEIKNLEKMLRRLIPEDINLKFSYKVDSLIIFIDPSQIEQILINLVVNAKDAIYEKKDPKIKEIVVSIEETIFRGRKFALISVKDTGKGIPKEIQKKIFEPFFTTKKAGIGTGLGLSTVYGIVMQNKGYVTVESEVGKGATFYIYLPVYEKYSEKPEKKEKEKEKFVDLPGGNEKILIVEDEKEIREIVKEMLETLGYKVQDAENGKEAIEILKRENYDFDLVISDIIMPEMDGYEMYREIKKINPNTKFLFITGYSENALHEYGQEFTNVKFLKKPFNIKELAFEIRKILNSQ